MAFRGLGKLAKYNTIVNVNGTERINQIQSDDATYDLTESFNTQVKVNGGNEGSWTQSSDSVYDVSASATIPSSFNWQTENSGSHTTSYSYYHQHGTVTVDSQNVNKYWRIYVSGGSGSTAGYGDWKLVDSSGNILRQRSYGSEFNAYEEFFVGFPGSQDTYSFHINSDAGGYETHDWSIQWANYVEFNGKNGSQIVPPLNMSVSGVNKY